MHLSRLPKKVTADEPLSQVLHGGDRDALSMTGGIKPRGHTGPRLSPTPSSLAALPSGSSVDVGAIVATTMLPMAMMLIERLAGNKSNQDASFSAAPKSMPRYLSPAIGKELYSCLTAFRDHKNIDLLECEELFSAQDLTPEILPDIAIERLTTLLNLTEDKVHQLQTFCKCWGHELEQYK
jgi:hypothetical protein